ncbi:hypothetical protein B7463_g10171, partial [Scytalidium lignicola]
MTKNSTQPAKNGGLPPKVLLVAQLRSTIDTMSAKELRFELQNLLSNFPDIAQELENRLLVQGKDVVRYHRDSDSENKTESSESSDSEDYEDYYEDHESDDIDASEDGAVSKSNGKSREPKPIKPISVGDKEYTSRYAKCENCKEFFDVTANWRGACFWHPGQKEVDDDSYIWNDHDDRCHGPPSAFENDPSYADGFMWDCCDESGDHAGCKQTKHKAAVNVIVPLPLPSPPPKKAPKRKAEEPIVTVAPKKKKGSRK